VENKRSPKFATRCKFRIRYNCDNLEDREVLNIDVKKVKIVVTAPSENVNSIRNVLGQAGAGAIGEYSYCSISTKCIGTFKGSGNANPYIGEKNKLEIVEEEKIEVICDIGIAKEVLKRLREVHPYEEPAIDIIPLINEEDL